MHLIHDGPILEITFNRPKVNTIGVKTSSTMGEALLNFRDDPELCAVIITDDDEKFLSVGWDLRVVAEGKAPDINFGPGGFAGLIEIFDFGKSVVATVDDYAPGGSLELVLAADSVVCVENASFALPGVKLGVVLDSDDVLRLPKLLPPAIVSEIVTTGRRMSAEEALRRGIVNRVASQGELTDSARELTQQLVNSVPLVITALEEIYCTISEMVVEEGYRYTRSDMLKHYLPVLHLEDVPGGPWAFVGRRDPVWKGR